MTMSAKIVVIVDHHVDLRNPTDVWFHVGMNVDPQRDVFFQTAPPSALDSSGTRIGAAGLMAIDATAKIHGECDNPSEGEVRCDAKIQQAINQRWEEFGLE